MLRRAAEAQKSKFLDAETDRLDEKLQIRKVTHQNLSHSNLLVDAFTNSESHHKCKNLGYCLTGYRP